MSRVAAGFEAAVKHPRGGPTMMTGKGALVPGECSGRLTTSTACDRISTGSVLEGGCHEARQIDVRRIVPLLIGIVLSLSACADKPYPRIIVIDPGHGGIDPGAIGSTGYVLEKEVALRMGFALRDQLEATGRYRVIMTRDDDRMIGLLDRLQLANQSQGELFISLHADSLAGAPQVRGAAVYTLSEPTYYDDPARWASEVMRADMRTGFDPSNEDDVGAETLIDLAQRATNGRSVRLAELLVQELNGATRMVKRRPAQASFIVLQSPQIPSVLVELGYLSNPADESALADDAHIARLATAIARAIDGYFGLEAS
jgi:N-acetylmuramoyl-L-alanine amidase